MKITLVQENYIIGDIQGNTQKIINSIRQAIDSDLLVFTELCVTGYPPRDLLFFKDFLDDVNEAILQIQSILDKQAVIIGAPTTNPNIKGKDFFNSAIFLTRDQRIDIHKTLLPTYDVFDEYRYFEPATTWQCVDYCNEKIAITVCEDIWNLEENPLYVITPMDEMIKQSPTIMINISASPFDYTHAEDRKAMILANVEKYKIPMVYCNSIGSQTEIIFDGGSIVMDGEGNIIEELPYFTEHTLSIQFENRTFLQPIKLEKRYLPKQNLNPKHLDFNLNIDRIYAALILGIQDYFEKMGFKKAIIGASGGIDSALTQVLAVHALGKENVTVLMMPSQFSTTHSIDDAVKLSENLGNEYHIIEIKPLYESFEKQLQPYFENLPFNVAEENIQARSRGILLMAIANKFGQILLNTTNKSEVAVGYGTLYGDMAGGLAVLADVYKMQVYSLCQFINRQEEIIPIHILSKAPSAELRPNQKDSDSLPDYKILDTILYQYIERALSPSDIIEQGFDKDLVYKTIKMVNNNEYKRAQFCPIIRVSPKAFGIGRRIPIVARYLN